MSGEPHRGKRVAVNALLFLLGVTVIRAIVFGLSAAAFVAALVFYVGVWGIMVALQRRSND